MHGGRTNLGFAVVCILLAFLPTSHADCPSGDGGSYYEYSYSSFNLCYFALPDVNTWTWCHAACGQFMMRMPTLSTEDQRSYLTSNVMPNYGGRSLIPIAYKDIYMDGQYSLTEMVTDYNYHPWANNEPSLTPNEYCAYLANDGLHNKRCDNADFQDNVLCVCEVDAPMAQTFMTSPIVNAAPALTSPCPGDWVSDPTSPGNCFHFDAAISNWEWCEAFCAYNGVSMACVADSNQNDFLANQISALQLDGIMLGLSDRTTEGTFVWDGATSCTSSFTSWYYSGGEPSSEFRKNCVYMTYDTNMAWQTSECDTLLTNPGTCVCQGPLISVSQNLNFLNAPTPKCPDAYVYSSAADVCYSVEMSTQINSWDWCHDTCDTYGMTMPVLTSGGADTYLRNLRVASGTSVYPLALRSDGESFKWAGNTITYQLGWASGYPDMSIAGADCAYLGANGWYNDACRGVSGLTCICQASPASNPSAYIYPSTEPPPLPACPTGWDRYTVDNKCYYVEEALPLYTWESCSSFCSENGVGMLCIESAGQNKFLKNLRSTHGVNKWPIGLRAPTVGDTYEWEGMCSSSYNGWVNNGANPHSDVCVFMWDGNYGWTDASCNEAHDTPSKCICESTPGLAPPTMNAVTCPTGWTYFPDSDKCYYVAAVSDAVHTWQSCHDFCSSNSVSMLCVQTIYEGDFIGGDLRGSTVITYPLGYKDLQNGDGFLWNTGCTSSFTAFDAIQPNHANADCVYMLDSGPTWIKDVCDGVDVQCVCEAPHATVPTHMTLPCPAGWVQYAADNKCYYVDTALTAVVNTWDACKHFCLANGANLPCVQNPAQNLFVNALRTSTDHSSPIGLSHVYYGFFGWYEGCDSAYTDNRDPNSQQFLPCAYLSGATDLWQTANCDNTALDVQCICEATPETAPALMEYNPCPVGWKYYEADSKCYYLPAVPAVNSWNKCNQYCTSNAVSMACVEDSAQNSFLYGLTTHASNLWYAIGLSDPQHDGSFEWNAGCTSSYLSHADSNNAAGVYCSYLSGNTDLWKTAGCDYDSNTPVQCVCEAPLATAPEVMVYNPCPTGWEYYEASDKCYFLNTVSTIVNTWPKCKDFCEDNSLSMLCLMGGSETAFVKDLKTSVQTVFPIGLRDDTQTNTVAWNQGCSSTTDFWPQVPVYDGSNCAYLWNDPSSTWTSAPCADLIDHFQCICESTPAAAPAQIVYPCPDGWEYYAADNKCYNVEPTVNTWNSCKAYCAVNNVDMLCVENSGQNDYLTALKATYGTANFPLGLSRFGAVSTYVWEPGCSSNFYDWNTGAPEPSRDPGENCAFIWTSNYKWNDAMCDFYYGDQDKTICACESTPEQAPATMFLPAPTSQPSSHPSTQWTTQPSAQPSTSPSAQPTSKPSSQPSQQPQSRTIVQPTTQPSSRPSRQPTTQPSGQPTSRPVAQPCPAGWHQYAPDGMCYYLPEYTSYSWDQCKAFCDANVVHMICIENAGQASFISGLGGASSVALGLKDSVGAGSYTWYSGCPSTYTIPWAATEPTGGAERCAAMGTGGFADYQCTPAQQSLKCGCESTARLAPTTMVGELRAALPSMLSSVTYVVKNGFAFAALANDRTVHTWGEAAHGGDSTLVQSSLQPGVLGIAHSKFAFAALTVSGSVYGWGVAAALVNAPTSSAVVTMIGNEGAFACRTATDRGVAFGSAHGGGSIPSTYTALLTSPNLRALVASSAAFAALMSDMTVYAWGNQHVGGGVDLNPVPNLSNIVKVVANREAFAAIDATGKVTTWGAATAGGDSSSVAIKLASQVEHIVGTRCAFAAFKADGSLVVWGYWKDGGDASAVAASLSSGVVAVAHTYTAMAALKSDGTAVCWGRDADGGDATGVALTNLVSIVGNSKAFAAITTAGGVLAWGRAAFGGTIPSNKVTALSSGVVSIYHTDRAFAALKAGGTVVVWGQAGHGGSPGTTVETLLAASPVHTVCANDAALSVVNNNGQVIAWGHPSIINAPGVVYQSDSLMIAAKCSAGAVGGSIVQ